MSECRTVTVGIIAYNEHKYLPDLLQDLLEQNYCKHLIEVILVDGASTDDTLAIMTSFKENNDCQFKRVKILKNEKRVQPAGWNVVINNMSCDVLIRVDAHARLPEDFVTNNIDCINSGEFVCGGPRENIIDDDTQWKRLLLSVEQSMFGSSFAAYRQDTNERKYVSSLFHGAYRYEVIEQVGLFNENLIRTEDNEFHYRIRKAGFRICYDPTIKSYFQTRSSLRGMIKQKYLNGFWIGRTIPVCPRCISVFHLVPFAFVWAIIITLVLLAMGVIWPFVVLWLAYGLVNLLMTLTSGIRSPYCLLQPALFLVLHVSYGVGTLLGLPMGVVCRLTRRR